jgi:hypothetical protein
MRTTKITAVASAALTPSLIDHGPSAVESADADADEQRDERRAARRQIVVVTQ